MCMKVHTITFKIMSKPHVCHATLFAAITVRFFFLFLFLFSFFSFCCCCCCYTNERVFKIIIELPDDGDDYNDYAADDVDVDDSGSK